MLEDRVAGLPIKGTIRVLAFDRHPGLAKVRDYLLQDVSRTLTLSIAARVAELNPKYFSALFHARVGVRFIDWLHFVRTEWAKQLLEDPKCSIAEAALRSGYNDLRTFERAFKKCNGRTAQQHRRRLAAAVRPSPHEARPARLRPEPAPRDAPGDAPG